MLNGMAPLAGRFSVLACPASSHLEGDVVDGEGHLRLQELAARLVHILPRRPGSSEAGPLGLGAQASVPIHPLQLPGAQAHQRLAP